MAGFTAGGPDANFNVDVNVDVDEAQAAAEFAKLAKAIATAMKSAEVQKSVQSIISSFSKAFTGVSKSSAATWKTVTQQGQASAHAIGKAFEGVAKSSRAAFSANQARGSSHELQALNQLVGTLAGSFEHLATDVRTTNTVLKEMSAGARAQLAAVTQEQRTLQQALTSQNATLNTQAQERANRLTNQTKLELAAIRQQSALDRNASNERIANIRRFTQIATTSIRSLTQVFRTVFNGATIAVRGFVNIAGAAIRGLASTFRATFSAINNIVRTFASGFSRAFSTIGRGVTSALAGVSRSIRSALSRDEKAVSDSMHRRERAMSASASRQQSIFSRIGPAAGILGGGAAVGSLLTSGFERAGQVEQLQLTFTALLGDGAAATAVLERLSEFARTTAFDFVEVAQSTAQLTAALGDVGQAEDLTRFLADVVALTGGTTEALGRVRLAMSQIAGAGRLDSANLRQITESLPGVPIAQILADRFFGGSMEAYSKARDAGELGGKISAEAFFEAFQEGTQERFPEVEGFAQVAAGTITGMTQNLKENFAIFGATLINLARGPIKTAIGGLNNFLALAGEFVSGEMFEVDQRRFGFSSITRGLTDAQEKLQFFRTVLGNVVKALGGLLALKGVWEVFGLLGRGIRLALTPMGLVVVAVAGITAAWTVFNRVSEKFAATWRIVTWQFRPAIEAVVRLGRAFRNAFSGGGGDGKPSILTRIGDAMRYVNVALARLIRGFTVFANVLSTGLELQGFENFFATLDYAVAKGLSVLFFGVNSEAAMQEARTRGGSLIFNLLEQTFLAPVIQFFRGPFLNAAKTVIGFISNVVGQIASAIGDIWGIIFGGGEDDPTAVMTDALFGTGADNRSTGTKVLDRLEETFLGPVVRFFRGPFADAIEGIGGFIGGLFENYVIPGFSAVVSFFARDFIPGIANIAGAIGNFLSPAVFAVGDLLGQVGTLLAPIGGAVQGFVETWKTEGVAKAFSSLWDGVVEAAGNLWEGENGTGGIKAGLEGALDSITSWFSTTFTGKNATGWALSALNGIRAVGERIGRFLGSPEFLGSLLIATAAIAGAVTAIIGAFTLGFLQGVYAEIPRWAKIISDGLSNAWDSLSKGTLKFLPDPVIDAISAVLGSPLLATGLAAGTLVLGGKIMSSIVSGIATASKSTKNGVTTRSFANLATNLVGGLFTAVRSSLFGVKGKEGSGGLFGGFRSLGAMLFPKPSTADSGATAAGRSIGGGLLAGARAAITGTGAFQVISTLRTKIKSAGERAKEQFGSIGNAIATAVVGGIIDYEINYQAGKSGSTGGKLLGLLFGTVTGASFGAAFGGVGAVIGAAVGGGIALLGQHFGEAAKKAEDFNTVVTNIRDSLKGLSADEQGRALLEDISNRLTENAGAFDRWGSDLADSGFNFATFVQQILDGTAEADRAFTDFLAGDKISAQIEAAGGDIDKFRETLSALQAAAKTGVAGNIGDLFNLAGIGLADGTYQDFMDTLDSVGYSFNDLNSIFGFFDTTVKGSAAAIGQITTQTNLVGQAMQDAVNPIDTVDEALQAIRDGLAQGDSAQEIANILSNDDLSATNALEALSQAADDVAEKLDKARDAFTAALEAVDVGVNDVGTKTFEGITQRIIADLPSIAQGFQQIRDDFNNGDIALNVKNARLGEGTDDFKNQIVELINAGVNEGLIVDDASMDTFLNNLKTQVNSAGLDVETTNMLNGIIDAFIAGDYSSLLDPIINAMTDQSTLSAAGQLMAERLTSAFRTTLGAAQALGGPAALGAELTRQGQAGPSVTLPKLDTSDLASIFSDADAAQVGQDVGEAVGEAVPDGFKAANMGSSLKAQLTATGAGLHATGLTSGQKVGVALVKGVSVGAAGMAQAGLSAGRAAAKGAAGGSSGMYSIGVNAGNAFARGVLSQVSAAARAAAAIAQAATNSAKTYLKVKSPSLVFRDIGQQVGAGFVKGIEDSTVTMTAALEKALTEAISTAVEAASEEVNKAKVAGELFDALQPSTLPGGTSQLEVTQATTGITTQLGGFLTDLRSGLGDALGGVANDTLREASEGLAGIRLATAGSFADLRGQYADAAAAKKAIDDYNKSLAALNLGLRNGTLATFAANQQRSQAYKDLIADQNAMNDKIARLGVQLRNGTITATNYNERVKDIRDSFNATTLERYHEELDRINRAYRNGSLAQEEYRRRLDELGGRPAALSFDQSNILASGTATLNLGTLAGQANNDTISDALSQIREWGQAALDSGQKLPDVIRSMETYVAKLRAQAVAFGLSGAQVDSLIKLFGLTDKQLQALKATVLSLNTSTVTGAENVSKINDQLSGIREYAQTLLSAGNAPDAVIAKVRQLRDALVAQAKAFGFNAAGIDALVKAAGLSDTALTDFIKQLNDYTKAVQGATGATPGSDTSQQGVNRPVVEELHVHVPYGDPEAVGRATINAMAYGGPTTW